MFKSIITLSVFNFRIVTLVNEEVKQDVTSVSTKVNELWTTLEETGFMNPRRTFYFQKMLEELEKTMKDVELEKEQSR